MTATADPLASTANTQHVPCCIGATNLPKDRENHKRHQQWNLLNPKKTCNLHWIGVGLSKRTAGTIQGLAVEVSSDSVLLDINNSICDILETSWSPIAGNLGLVFCCLPPISSEYPSILTSHISQQPSPPRLNF